MMRFWKDVLFCIGCMAVVYGLVCVFFATEKNERARSVWALYSGEWGNPAVDGRWRGWVADTTASNGDVFAPQEIESSLYPRLGLYSSHDVSVLRVHCAHLKEAGIDSVIVQWMGSSHKKENEEDVRFVDTSLELMMNVSLEYGIKVGVLIDHYKGRSHKSLRRDVRVFHKKFRKHRSLLTVAGKPVVFIYNPHLVELPYQFIDNLRLTDDSYFIATVAEKQNMYEAVENGFDAVSSFFASGELAWSSDTSNWKWITEDCASRHIAFIPAVSPGYDNGKPNTAGQRTGTVRSRDNGEYYKNMWRAATKLRPPVVLVNSFNNWREGSAIEPAMDRWSHPMTETSWARGQSSAFYIHETKNMTEGYNAIR